MAEGDLDAEIEVVVEVPRRSHDKYEFDHERGVIRLDRRLVSTTCYPADYGFIPGMADEHGPDAKIICLPARDLRWDALSDLEHLPEGLSPEIRQFFEIYNDVEAGKDTSVKGYQGHQAAGSEVRACRQRLGSPAASKHAEAQP